MYRFSDLSFFARHYNMDENKLYWCILEDKTEKEYQKFLLGIRVKDSKIAISVEEKKLRRIKRGKLVAHDALLSKKSKTQFKLTSVKPLEKGNKIRLVFSEKNMADLYRDQWYDSSLD